MEKRLKTQIENSEEIRNVLREVDIKFDYKGSPIQTLLVYLPCTGGYCDHSELFRVIKETLMTNFVFSCADIKRKLSIRSEKTMEELFEKAVRKISMHTAHGELGELLLFTLLDVYFEAPKILSKISFKTNRRMPVYGADAVHAQFIKGELRLYLGESKLHKSFKGAASSATVSISNCMKKYSDEFDLIDSHIDFPEMDTEIREELIGLLNPFDVDNDSISEILHSPCFIGFVEPSIFSDDVDTYQDKYIEVSGEYIEDFFSKLEAGENDIDKTALLLLPFSSIDDLVEGFISYMGIQN